MRKNHGPGWWDAISYGGGTQSYPKSSEWFNDPILDGFNFNALAILETLTFVVWKESDWVVQASAPFIKRGLRGRLDIPAIRNHLHNLESAELIRVTKRDNDFGHYYLVAPVLLRLAVAEPMKNYAAAQLLLSSARMRTSDLFDHSSDAPPSDLFDHSSRSKGSLVQNQSCLTSDQNDRLDLDPILLLDGAQRQEPLLGSAGGVAGGAPKRCHGQDHTPRREGRLTADDFESRRQAMLAQVKTLIGAPNPENPVGNDRTADVQA